MTDRIIRHAGHPLRVLAACMLALVTLMAHGQQDRPASPPAGLQWQWMGEAVIDSPNFKSSANDNELKLLKTIWAKEIAASRPDGKGGRFPSFILVGSVTNGPDVYVLSLYNRAFYESCEDPPNDRSATRMYSICPLRVNRFDKAGTGEFREFPGFCYLNLDSSDSPRAKNHTEYAVDPRTGIAYFRVIQHGKLVPECNRSVPLSKR